MIELAVISKLPEQPSLEAVALHQLDNLDAKLQNCLTAMEKADGARDSAEFTNPKGSVIRKGYYRVRPSEDPQASRHLPQPGESNESEDGDGSDGPPQPPQRGLWG